MKSTSIVALTVKQYQITALLLFYALENEAMGLAYRLPGPPKEKRERSLADPARSGGAPAVVGACSEIDKQRFSEEKIKMGAGRS